MLLQAASLMTKYIGYLGVQAMRQDLSDSAKTGLRQHAPWANLVAACTLLHVKGPLDQVLCNLEQVSSMPCVVHQTAACPTMGIFLMDCSLPKSPQKDHNCTFRGLSAFGHFLHVWVFSSVNGTPIGLGQAELVLATR